MKSIDVIKTFFSNRSSISPMIVTPFAQTNMISSGTAAVSAARAPEPNSQRVRYPEDDLAC
jgi:hypothetical protein